MLFMDFDPIEIARQLTLIDEVVMKDIRPRECFGELSHAYPAYHPGQAWMKKDSDRNAPNIVKYTMWFNEVNRWVQTEILSCQTNTERVDVFKKFLEVCDVYYTRVSSDFLASAKTSKFQLLHNGNVRAERMHDNETKKDDDCSAQVCLTRAPYKPLADLFLRSSKNTHQWLAHLETSK